MPIYEYRCNACGKPTSFFVRVAGDQPVGTCEQCGSTDLSRLFSRVAVHRSSHERGGFDESSLDGVDENDPRSVAGWVRTMTRELGEPLDPGMEADLERMEAGEMPDDYADEPEEDFAGVD